MQFNELRSHLKAERRVRQKYFPTSQLQVLYIRAINQAVQNIRNEGTVQHLPSFRRRPATDNFIENAKTTFVFSPEAFISLAVIEFDIGYSAVGKTLSHDLNWEKN